MYKKRKAVNILRKLNQINLLLHKEILKSSEQYFSYIFFLYFIMIMKPGKQDCLFLICKPSRQHLTLKIDTCTICHSDRPTSAKTHHNKHSLMSALGCPHCLPYFRSDSIYFKSLHSEGFLVRES